MPWHVSDNHDECPAGKPYAVVKDDDGEVEGCHESRAEADEQVRALYASEEDEDDMSTTGDTAFQWNVDTSTGSGSTFTVTFTPQDVAALAEAAEDTDDDFVQWEGILAVEGYKTNDRRYLMSGEMSERDLPLPLMAQTVTEEGHKGAVLAGKIEEIWRVPNDEYGDGAVEVWARGVFDTNEVGRETARQVETEMLTGVSVDIDPTEYLLLDQETLEEIDPDTLDFEDLMFGEFVTGIKGNYMGATLTPFPAIEHASIAVTKEKAIVASAFASKVVRMGALTAAARGMAPMRPPRDWFFQTEADRPTPLTVTDDGRVFGHLAAWGTCHTGISGVCRMAPRSRTGYAWYHLGEIQTDEGEMVAIGKLTVDTDHASTDPRFTPEMVRAHYDNTGTVAAYVRASDGRHGIWLSGAVKSDASLAAVRELRANPPSGDWRAEGGGLELQAALAVVVPGFPVPRYELSLCASGAEEAELTALIQTGYVEEPPGPKESLRRTMALKKRARRLLSV